jgi:hypothetical protein
VDLGGFYMAVTRRLGASEHSPAGLLALVVVTAGGLSAVLVIDWHVHARVGVPITIASCWWPARGCG